MSFQNVYYKRATATPRACYVCSKPTTACLATTNATDFLYACEAHLSDTGFATELVDPGHAAAAAKQAVSKEEIARVKAEWEAKETRKKDKDKDSKAKSGGKDVGDEAQMEEGGKKGAKSPSPSGTASPTAAGSGSGSGAATPTHKRYSLHRDFFTMRQAEHRRKKQTKQTQELVPRLPGAPHGSILG